MDLHGLFIRIRDEVCHPIPPSEYLAWATFSGNIVYPAEYAILKEVDAAYCDEMNAELRSLRERRKEQMERESEKKGKRNGHS